MKSKSPELKCFIGVLFSLSIFVQTLFTSARSPLWMVLFLELLILGVSLELGELLAALMVEEFDLPRLGRLNRLPSVAVLFLVCDDVVREALDSLPRQSYQNADFFILDDSKDHETKSLLDGTTFRVVRRLERRGYKAGALNNWLKLYGNKYEYFLVLDSDSIIPRDFVESIIKYAEHPANAQVGIFNSLPQCWNTNSQFPRLLATVNPLRNWIRIRLANRSNSTLSTGHNNLHRTRAALEVGGFDEDFIAEDIAVTLKLIRAGYTSKLVNLVSYEVEPEHIFSYVKRLKRWARQTVQIQRADWRGIPLSSRFEMFKLTCMYLGFFLCPVWAVLIAWGSKSSLADMQSLAAILRHGRPLIWLPLVAATVLPFIVPLIKIPLLIRLDIRLRDYASHWLLSLAIACYAMFTVCLSQIGAATASTLEFEVTDKRSHHVTLHSILFNHWHLIPFWLFLALGFWRNPVALIFSALWMMLLFFAPLLIYVCHKPR